MTITVYHLKNCDTCRAAIKALVGGGHKLQLIDVRADGISAESLKKIAGAVGSDVLLNTRSATWRKLTDAEKTNVDDDKALQLMGKYPTLIKRPVIDTGSEITVGWTKDIQSKFL